MAAPTYHSAEMVRALIDESRAWPRYETVHGELLVTPAPRLWHQEVVARLFIALRAYAERVAGIHVFMSPADISWGADTLVQPDVFVVPTEQARTLTWKEVTTLLVAAEVLSPSTIRADKFTKRHLYQEKQVDTYWVIDGDTKLAEVWHAGDTFPQVEEEVIRWRAPNASIDFEMSLAELFAPI